MKRRLNYYRFLLRIVCYFLPALALFSSELILSVFHVRDVRAGVGPYGYLGFLGLMTTAWAVAAEHYKVSSVQELFHERTGIRAASAACAVTSAVQFGVLFFFQLYTSFSRVFLALSLWNLLMMTLAMRAVFRALVRRHTGLLWKPNRILMIGVDQFARRCAHRLLRGPLSLCRITAYIRLPGQTIAVKDAPVFSMAEIESVCRKFNIDEVLLAIPPRRYSEGPEIVKAAGRLAMPVRAIVDFGDHMTVRDRIFQVGRLQVLDLTATPAESVKYALLKRSFDIVFSILAVAATAPVMALIAVAIRLTSPGPVLFVQERFGFNNDVIRVLKFRSMYVDRGDPSGAAHTVRGDARVTRLGRWLRVHSLDELPQLLNVLRGEMSLVGPRPHPIAMKAENLYYHDAVEDYLHRHKVKPGITGWAQVNGLRGEITSVERAQHRVDYDLWYIDHWSIWLDLKILALSLKVIFETDGAF